MNDDIFKIDIDSMVTESTDDVMNLSIDDNYNENGHEERMESFFNRYATNEETRKKVAAKRAAKKAGKSVNESVGEINIPLNGTKDYPTEDAYNANLAKLRKSFNDALDAFEAYSKKRK